MLIWKKAALLAKFRSGPIATMDVDWYSLESQCKVELKETGRQAPDHEHVMTGTTNNMH